MGRAFTGGSTHRPSTDDARSTRADDAAGPTGAGVRALDAAELLAASTGEEVLEPTSARAAI